MNEYDVIVVGAGLSGLRSASLLDRQGLRVKVLEASDRVGGRLKQYIDNDGTRWDIGGQWVGPRQEIMEQIMKEYDLKKIPQYDDTVGKAVFRGQDGEREVYEGGSFYPGGDQYQQCVSELDRLASTLPITRAWNHPDAKALDSVTVSDWVKLRFPPDVGVRPSHTACKSLLVSEEEDVSLLFWLTKINRGRGLNQTSSGNVENLSLTKNGAQQDKIEGGASGLCNLIYERELKAKSLVEFNSAVATINHSKNGACVVTFDERIYFAKRVIVTIPPNMVRKVSFVPKLKERDEGLSGFTMASVIKVIVKYENCYWFEEGYSGVSCSYESNGIQETYDATAITPDGKKQPALVVLIGANTARSWGSKSLEERKKLVLNDLAYLFNNEKYLNPKEYIEQVWSSEKYCEGGYMCVTKPGVLTKYGDVLFSNTSCLYWAGTEMASRWSGFMEGAVDSACNAVKEVIGSLKSTTSKL
eukprot:TRINITY_DN8957_c0_g1_i1.p1 TRINITY_DN8957_c0_g1~~TRINITY_DN8957_c0_g1_i1.p1  ORF type:complete len:472 (+),score=55.27 TRINITY_DN8957_c0_g1_i1:21-1436(+)